MRPQRFDLGGPSAADEFDGLPRDSTVSGTVLSIDWALPAEMIRQRIRVHAKPYFPAYAFAYNRMLAVNSARVHDRSTICHERPGEILAVENDRRFVVACGEGTLIVEDYEMYQTPGSDDEWRLYIASGTRLN